jgi:hypothetical protein
MNNLRIKSAAIFIMVYALLILGCTKSSAPETARQRELAAILKPFLASTEVGGGDDAEVIHGWTKPTNQQALKNFTAKYPDTEEAYEAELWLSFATAPVSLQTFQQKHQAAEMAERLKVISQKTSCPGTQKMAELERAFALYQERPGDHADFYQQVNNILVGIQDFKSEESGPFRRYLQTEEIKPSEIEPNLRFLVTREKCIDHKQAEALALAKELKQKYPNWESQSVNGEIEMIELYQSGWTLPWSHGALSQN